jgi:8-oxo-dGTP pyrophosphatase MutT (NUDIX family)
MNKDNNKRRKTVSCGGLPVRHRNGDVEVLLIKQFEHKDSWGIPKGHTAEGETPEQCALREVREEAGVVVELGHRLPDVGCSFRDEDKTVMSWLCTVVGSDEPRHDDPDCEVADARWFNVNELPTIHVYQRPLLAAAVDVLMGRAILLKVDVR